MSTLTIQGQYLAYKGSLWFPVTLTGQSITNFQRWELTNPTYTGYFDISFNFSICNVNGTGTTTYVPPNDNDRQTDAYNIGNASGCVPTGGYDFLCCGNYISPYITVESIQPITACGGTTTGPPVTVNNGILYYAGDGDVPPDMSIVRDWAEVMTTDDLDSTIPLVDGNYYQINATLYPTFLWVTDVGSNGNVWNINPSIVGTSYNVGNTNAIGACCLGPDGNLWTIDYYLGNTIYKVTPSGIVTLYTFSSGGNDAAFTGLCAGPDGNIWACDYEYNNVWQITTDGVGIAFAYTGAVGNVEAICNGPDGNLWVICVGSEGPLLKVTPDGTITTIFTWSGSEPTVTFFGICTGSDGNLWLADQYNAYIWKVTTAGIPTYYPLGTAYLGPNNNTNCICSGSDGNIWTTDGDGNVWQITTSGVPTKFPLTGSVFPTGICAASDGNLWVTDESNYIWQVTTAGIATQHLISASLQYSFGICQG